MKKISRLCIMFLLTFSSCVLMKNSQSISPSLPPPPPTLSLDLQENLYKSLKTNSNCELPCFLGLTPGESSLSEAKLFLETYSVLRSVEPDSIASTADYQWYSSRVDMQNFIDLAFFISIKIEKRTTQGIIVNFGPILLSDRRADMQNKLLERYGILEILQRHGVPDEIYLNPTRTRQTQSAYSIEIVYNKAKILARYYGIAKLAENDKYELCPAIGDGNVDSFTIALGNPLDTEANIIELAWGSFNKSFNLKSYQDKHQKLNVEAIYNLFIEQGKRCFYEDEYWIN